MDHVRTAAVTALAALLVALPVPARASRESVALAAKGTNHIYNLDYQEAISAYRQAVAADPQDAGALRGLASALWLSMTYRRGNMTVDDYIGSVGRRPTATTPPPPETAAQFRDALERALALARRQVAASPRSVEAHYQLGAAVGLRASYIATVESSAMAAVRAAREAYDEHETVLNLDAGRRDAGLIVGTYRYIVAALSLPLRWAAYIAGFGGGKAQGMRLIEEAAAFPGDNQTDARLALILIYNREQRYDDALKQLAVVRSQYPRNRLVWLESGSTSLRAGYGAQSEKFLSDGLARFADDARPRMFGEDALWYYKRGAARANLQHVAEAEQDLTKSLSLEGRKWVHGRAHLELGKLALKAGRSDTAKTHVASAIRLALSDNDAATADDARRLMK